MPQSRKESVEKSKTILEKLLKKSPVNDSELKELQQHVDYLERGPTASSEHEHHDKA